MGSKIGNTPTGGAITAWRRGYFDRRITRHELAEASGIGYATLTRWENNGTDNAHTYRLEHLVVVMRGMESNAATINAAPPPAV